MQQESFQKSSLWMSYTANTKFNNLKGNSKMKLRSFVANALISFEK